MPNFEFKKDPMSEGGLNLALNSIVIVLLLVPISLDARISTYGIFGTLGKAPAAR